MSSRASTLTWIVDVVVLSVHVVVVWRHRVRIGRIRLVVVVVLIQVGIGGRSFVLSVIIPQDIETACRAGLLTLEPRAQAGRMEDMPAGQFLRGIYHVLSENGFKINCNSDSAAVNRIHSPANDANIIRLSQFFGRCVRIERIHVSDGASRQYDIVQCLLEIPANQNRRFSLKPNFKEGEGGPRGYWPHRIVHWSECKQWQRVYSDHDGHEKQIQHHANEPDHQFGVQQENGLILPRIIRAHFGRMQHILDGDIRNHRYQDGIFETEHQLHGRTLGNGRLICVRNHQIIEESQHTQQRRNTYMEYGSDHWTSFHLNGRGNGKGEQIKFVIRQQSIGAHLHNQRVLRPANGTTSKTATP